MEARPSDNRLVADNRRLVVRRPKARAGAEGGMQAGGKGGLYELPKLAHRSVDHRKASASSTAGLPSLDPKGRPPDSDSSALELLRASVFKLESQIDTAEHQLSSRHMFNIGLAKNLEKLIGESMRLQKVFDDTVRDNENTKTEISTKGGIIEKNKHTMECKKRELSELGIFG